MGPGSLLRETWELIPVLILLAAGAMIALRSGVDRPETGQNFRQLIGNLSHMLLRVLGYLGVLIALQYFIGMRSVLGW
jgi:hypothetical protein